MPSDVVSLVTTGLGVSVLAGILSGICYVWAHGVGTTKRIRKKDHSDFFCEICGTFVKPTSSNLNESPELVKCSKCGSNVCSTKCAKFVQQTQWICMDCLKPTQSWFQGLLRAIQPNKTSVYSFGRMLHPELQPNLEKDALRKLEKEQVRDFIEKLVNVMLGENVDNASVSMLCNDNNYMKLFQSYHRDLSSTLTDLGSTLHISMSNNNLPVTGQSPCTAHAALKQLIEKLLKEAVNLPLLEKAHAQPAIPSEETTNKSYEDLLATAIINKVITSCQNNLPSSSSNSVSSSSRNKDGKEYFFGEETLDKKWKTTDLDTTSVSSLEEWLQSSDNSFGSRKYVDKVTLMIKQDIEEVENVDSENEDDDAEYFLSSSSLLDDSESNWFLQKRHFQGTASPVPVPMLVPNPSTEAKVLIGDKPLDDTSDLSDVGSDVEESAQPQTAQTLLIQSKNLIGGAKKANKNYENADVQSESSTDSGVKEMNGNAQKSFDILGVSVGKTDISIDDDNIEDSSFISVYSNTEKEAEYTERYASLPRQILKTSTPQNHKIASENDNEDEILEDTSDFEFIGGTYSKKEKEKWTHAVEMKNNPYSKENIEKRIKRSNSSTGSVFGPDYYARLASKPSGGGKASSEINGVSWPPPQQIDFTRSGTPSPPPELPKSAPPPKKLILEHPKTTQLIPATDLILDIPPEPPKTTPPPFIIETNGIHKAVKALVTPEDHIMPHETFEEVHKVESYSVQVSTAQVTSESDTSFINFYDVEHGQVMKKTENEDIHRIPIKQQAPVAKPRVLGGESKKYEKAAAKNSQRNILPIERPTLRRHLSESSLLDESSDAHPKVLHQKKDNTLISKIYKDPKVRLFAMNSREDVIHGNNNNQYLNQRSLDSKIALGASASDDGLTSEYESGKTGKMSFFSSEEDLLSLNNSEVSFVATKNGGVKLNESEHRIIRTPSPSSLRSPNTPNTRKFIYSSQEDLLSIDEVGSLPQRKDNTLISKIYQDHKVRNFALNTHRGFQPDLQSKPRKVSSSDEEHYHYKEKVTLRKRTFAHEYNSYDDLSSADMSFEDNYQNGHNLSIHQKPATLGKASSTVSSVNDGYNSEDLEIEEIARRHVVREALGKFSKSEMVINSKFHRGTSFEEGDVRVSVRDLRKKFESNDASNKPVVSSLTARSISKKVKDSLKQ